MSRTHGSSCARPSVLTSKQAAVHLAIVTAGVLIALSSRSGARVRAHQRSLVRERKADLVTELQANKNELERYIGQSARRCATALLHAMAGHEPTSSTPEHAEDGLLCCSRPRFESGFRSWLPL